MLCPFLSITHCDQLPPTGLSPEDSSENDEGPRKHEERLKKFELKLEEKDLSFYSQHVRKEVMGLNGNRGDSVEKYEWNGKHRNGKLDKHLSAGTRTQVSSLEVGDRQDSFTRIFPILSSVIGCGLISQESEGMDISLYLTARNHHTTHIICYNEFSYQSNSCYFSKYWRSF